MAQEADNEILLKISISEEEVEKKVLAAREAIVKLNKEYAALRKELAAGIITDNEFARSQQAIEKQLASANKQVREGNKVLDEYTQSQKKSEQMLVQMQAGLGKTSTATVDLQKRISDLAAEFIDEAASARKAGSSLDSLDEKIAILTKEYNGLTKAQRENKEIGGVLLKTINTLTKEQDKSQKIVDDSRKGVIGYVRDLNILGTNVGTTFDAFKSGAQGVGTFTKAIFAGRGALIALTAVPIVLILTGLVALLTKSQKGMDFLAQATGAVSSVLSLLTDKLVSVGSAFVGLFTNTRQTLADLGTFIETNLINRFKAFGVILEAIRSGDLTKLVDGFAQLGTGVTDATAKAKKFASEIGAAAKAGSDLAKAAQAIEEGEIKLNVQRGKSLVLIEKNKQLSEDTSKSAATRITAAKKAYAEEEKLQKSKQALQLKRIELARQQAKVDAKGGLASREQRKKISEEEEKYQQIAAEAIGKRTEIQNNINSIEAEAAAKSLENAKKAAQEEVNAAEAALIVARRKGEDTIAIEEEVYKRTLIYIEKKKQADLVGVKKGSAERRLLIEKANTEQLDATKVYADKVSAITYSAKIRDISSALALVQRGSKAELDLRIETLEIERNKQQEVLVDRAKNLDKQRKAGAITEKQYREASTKVDLENGLIVNTAARAIADARLEYTRNLINKEAELRAQALQTELNQGDQTLANEHRIAAERIELERDTQSKLLALEDINDKERDTRQKAIDAKAVAARRDLAKQERLDDLSNERARSEARQAQSRSGSKNELKEHINQINIQRKVDIENAQGNADEIAAINAKADRQISDARKAAAQQTFDDIVNVLTTATATLSSIIDAQTQAQLTNLDDEQEAVLSSAALSADARAKIEADFQKKKDKIEKEAAEKRRKIASVENLINTAVAVTKAFATGGPIVGAILAALAIATGIAQQVVIDTQKFATGGVYRSDRRGAYVTGPGSGKSDSINARISNGEAIINAESTRRYYPQLSAINVAGGGRAFPGVAKYSGPMYSAQHATPKFAYGGVGGGFDTQLIASAIIQGMSQVNIRVGVDEITQKQKSAGRVQAAADI